MYEADRIERVARALCTEDGNNPDTPQQTDRMIIRQQGNMTVTSYEDEPGWKRYEKEARRFIAAHNAL